MKGSRPKFRFLPLVAAAMLTALFAWAGTWQMHRAHYKDGLQERMALASRESAITVPGSRSEASQLEFRRLVANGRWLADKTVFLDNKVRDGIVGYEVVTPIRLDRSELCILVNRGWVAAPRSRSDVPDIPTPVGPIEVEGIARIPTSRFIELSGQSIVGRVWENLTLERYSRWSGLQLQPVLIYQAGGPADGLIRVTPAPEVSGLGADRHRGYAFMWFSLAALTVLIASILTFKNLKRHDQN